MAALAKGPLLDDIMAFARRPQTGVSLRYMMDFGADPNETNLVRLVMGPYLRLVYTWYLCSHVVGYVCWYMMDFGADPNETNLVRLVMGPYLRLVYTWYLCSHVVGYVCWYMMDFGADPNETNLVRLVMGPYLRLASLVLVRYMSVYTRTWLVT